MRFSHMQSSTSGIPLVYSCSGCSSAAQLANHLAVALDREGSAQMSCIAGVGGNVPHLVKIAQAGRPILAIDGCPLACVLHCLRSRGVQPDMHVLLSEQGVRKRYHADFDPAQADMLLGDMRRRVRALAHIEPVAATERRGRCLPP